METIPKLAKNWLIRLTLPDGRVIGGCDIGDRVQLDSPVRLGYFERHEFFKRWGREGSLSESLQQCNLERFDWDTKEWIVDPGPWDAG